LSALPVTVAALDHHDDACLEVCSQPTTLDLVSSPVDPAHVERTLCTLAERSPSSDCQEESESSEDDRSCSSDDCTSDSDSETESSAISTEEEDDDDDDDENEEQDENLDRRQINVECATKSYELYSRADYAPKVESSPIAVQEEEEKKEVIGGFSGTSALTAVDRSRVACEADPEQLKDSKKASSNDEADPVLSYSVVDCYAQYTAKTAPVTLTVTPSVSELSRTQQILSRKRLGVMSLRSLSESSPSHQQYKTISNQLSAVDQEIGNLEKQLRALATKKKQLLASRDALLSPSKAPDSLEVPLSKTRNDRANTVLLQLKDWNQRNWNSRFQAVCSAMMNVEERAQTSEDYFAVNTQLLHLSQDFIQAAKMYGRLIITERYLKEKTIEPSSSLGGAAGGEKFMVNNLLFKFAVDSEKLYGDDASAAKVAGQELKGLMAYYKCVVPSLRVPLMALVDFLGFRLIAMSVLPIDNQSIVYGTADGGRSFHTSNRSFRRIMRSASRMLNLREHCCGPKQQRLYSAADIEGHLGSDEYLYLLDFSRTFPPVQPDCRVKNGHLFQMFRPEFVADYPTALCPDAYTGFIQHDPKATEYNQDVRTATKSLLTETIPIFARQRLRWVVREAISNNSIESLSLGEHMHRAGINLRFLGFVLDHVIDHDVSLIILVEALSRALKNELRRELRLKMREIKVPMMAPYRQLVIDFMNRIFGNADSVFWDETLLPHLQDRFYMSRFSPSTKGTQTLVSEITSSPTFLADSRSRPYEKPSKSTNNLNAPPGSLRGILFERFSERGTLAGYVIFLRLCKFMRLEFTSTTVGKVKSGRELESPAPFDLMDLMDMEVRVKHTPLVTNAEGLWFSMKAAEALESRGKMEAITLYHRAVSKFEQALNSDPNNYDAILNLARVWNAMLEISHASSDQSAGVYFPMSDPDVMKTNEYYLSALDLRPENAHLHSRYAVFLSKCRRWDLAEAEFMTSLELNANDPDSLEAYADFLNASALHVEATAFLQRATALRNISPQKPDDPLSSPPPPPPPSLVDRQRTE